MMRKDRGGLLYPSAELVMVLHSLKKYAEVYLAKAWKCQLQPLKAAVDNAAEVLQKRELKCSTPGHHEKLVNVVFVKFFRTLVVNFATSVTNRHDTAKVFACETTVSESAEAVARNQIESSHCILIKVFMFKIHFLPSTHNSLCNGDVLNRHPRKQA